MTEFLTGKSNGKQDSPEFAVYPKGDIMMDQAQANKLCEDNELAFFRADVCPGSRESLTLDEQSQICDDGETTNKAIEEAFK